MPRPGRGMRHVGGLRFGYGAFPSRIGRPHRGQHPRGDTGASRCRRSGGFLAGGWPHGGPIILPRDYGRRPAARSSVLYLLDGCCDSHLSWTRSTDIVPDPIEESIYAENLAFTRPPAAAEHPGHRRPIRQRHPQLALLAARVAQGMAGDRTSPRHQLASDVVPAARRRSAVGASHATARWRRGLHS
jgi:hypothetical protein